MKTIVLSAAVATVLAMCSFADAWPEGSCVVSGSTNRTCSVVLTQLLTTPLDSYWQDVVSESFENKFLTRGPSGLCIIVR